MEKYRFTGRMELPVNVEVEADCEEDAFDLLVEQYHKEDCGWDLLSRIIAGFHPEKKGTRVNVETEKPNITLIHCEKMGGINKIHRVRNMWGDHWERTSRKDNKED